MMRTSQLLRILALPLSITACASSAISPAELALDNTGDTCTAIVKGTTHQLNLIPPCAFVNNSSGVPKFWQYDNLGKVYIVTGKPATEAQLKKWNVSADLGCAKISQHLIVGERVLTGKRNIRALLCPNGAVDEKFFRDVKNKL